MKMDNPLVSVVICVHNAGEYLRDAVLSITRQTYTNIEILIYDDGSTDACLSTIDDIRDSRIRIFHLPHRGKPVALNLALEEMKGEFYLIQDADDTCYPTRIERQLNTLLEHADLAGVFCCYDLIFQNRTIAPTYSHLNQSQCRAYIENFLMPGLDPTIMYRRAMVQGIRYDETLVIGQGHDYILKVGEQYPLMVLGECLYSYRFHYNSITKKNISRRKRFIWELQKKACERRGLDPGVYLPPPPEETQETVYSNSERDNAIVSHFMKSVLDLRDRGLWMESIRTAISCASLHPLDVTYYKALLYAVIPRGIVRYYKEHLSRKRIDKPLKSEIKAA